jgi:microsomal dipeptidase-like Zn-dependent dipeptidase
LKTLFFIVLLISLVTIARASENDPNGTVELHAHLFMKEGMGWGFNGGFFGPLQATSWRDRLSSQVNPEALSKSGLSIVVASLYAHPLFTWSLRDSIRSQIRLARKFVLNSENWIIATEPEQAKEALAQGKHVIVLALEGASGILETEDDFREFIDEGGIRIVGPLHLTDDEYGGVAFLKGWRVLSDPLAWLMQLFGDHESEGAKLNPTGLSPEGRALIKKLLDRHVWIDLAHASDQSMGEMISMIREAGQPLLYTHTILRRFHHAERGISQNQLAEIHKSGGILGLMPSADMLEGAPRSPTCPSALYGLAQEYKEVAGVLGNDAVMLGSDYNGGVEHLEPGCKTGTSLDEQGLWNMSQVPDLWKSLKVLGAPVPDPLAKMVDRFVDTWKKVSAI